MTKYICTLKWLIDWLISDWLIDWLSAVLGSQLGMSPLSVTRLIFTGQFVCLSYMYAFLFEGVTGCLWKKLLCPRIDHLFCYVTREGVSTCMVWTLRRRQSRGTRRIARTTTGLPGTTRTRMGTVTSDCISVYIRGKGHSPSLPLWGRWKKCFIYYNTCNSEPIKSRFLFLFLFYYFGFLGAPAKLI